MADPASFRQALFLAIDIARTRANFLDMHQNPLQKLKKPVLKEEEGDVVED